MFRQAKTSSALGRVMGRGFTLTDVTPEPFHCFNGDAHNFGLVKIERPVVVQEAGVEISIDIATELRERCKRCKSERPFFGSVPA